MRNYSADKELEDILLKFGFIETTDKRNQLKGKKEFRLSKSAQKKIYFDYINIIVIQRLQMYSLGTRVTLDDVVFILSYFILSYSDLKELFYSGSFTLEGAKNRLNSIDNEYKFLVEFDLRKPRREKLERIICTIEDIKNKILYT